MKNPTMVFALKFCPDTTTNFSPALSTIPVMQFSPQAKTTPVKYGDDSNGSTILRQREDAVFVLRTNDVARALARYR